MTLEEIRTHLQANPHLHCDNAQCLKLLEIIAVLWAGLTYVDGFATGYLETMSTHQGFHRLLTTVRGLAERANELERSL